jgi:hypothetical protein
MNISRRQTLMASGAAGLSLTGCMRTAPTIQGKFVSPNEKVNLAAIGIGQQGGNILRTFAADPNVNIVALCDVDIDSNSPVVPKGTKKYAQQGWMSSAVHHWQRRPVGSIAHFSRQTGPYHRPDQGQQAG